jgi:hypothetical protein
MSVRSIRIFQDRLYFSSRFVMELKNVLKQLSASACLSVSDSVLPHGTTCLPIDEFSRNFKIGNISKICPGISISTKIFQE